MNDLLIFQPHFAEWLEHAKFGYSSQGDYFANVENEFA